MGHTSSGIVDINGLIGMQIRMCTLLICWYMHNTCGSGVGFWVSFLCSYKPNFSMTCGWLFYDVEPAFTSTYGMHNVPLKNLTMTRQTPILVVVSANTAREGFQFDLQRVMGRQLEVLVFEF